jgi:choline dehydrogenase-like flavoprotein
MDHVYVHAEGYAPALLPGTSIEEGRCLYLPRFDARDSDSVQASRGYGAQVYLLPDDDERSRFLATSFGEMLPRPENRVTLDSVRRDAWEIPALHIACSHGNAEFARTQDQIAAVRDIAGLTGATLMSFIHGRPPGVAIHECGTARMGSDPGNSVVDQYNQCWEAQGVYVTDGACFPSQGSQNPTLTIMALTARACDSVIANKRDRPG